VIGPVEIGNVVGEAVGAGMVISSNKRLRTIRWKRGGRMIRRHRRD
jgi:hypothetical protein